MRRSEIKGASTVREHAAADGRGFVLCAVDIGGRSSVNFDVEIPTQKVGDFDTELVKEFVWRWRGRWV